MNSVLQPYILVFISRFLNQEHSTGSKIWCCFPQCRTPVCVVSVMVKSAGGLQKTSRLSMSKQKESFLHIKCRRAVFHLSYLPLTLPGLLSYLPLLSALSVWSCAVLSASQVEIGLLQETVGTWLYWRAKLFFFCQYVVRNDVQTAGCKLQLWVRALKNWLRMLFAIHVISFVGITTFIHFFSVKFITDSTVCCKRPILNSVVFNLLYWFYCPWKVLTGISQLNSQRKTAETMFGNSLKCCALHSCHFR